VLIAAAAIVDAGKKQILCMVLRKEVLLAIAATFRMHE